jgi:hypothetical protein
MVRENASDVLHGVATGWQAGKEALPAGWEELLDELAQEHALRGTFPAHGALGSSLKK